MSELTNETLRIIHARRSLRTYDPTPLTEGEKQTILEAAMRAPTAGNMMLYSIIRIEDQAIKDRLAVTCDDQPFIARAPWVLLFVADFQKWIDLFAVSDVEAVRSVEHRAAPGVGDLMIACSDALIAAQTAVLAAESLGIGSCYIGDVMEQAEVHTELLDLPYHTFPVAMLCLGRPGPGAPRRTTPHYTEHVVHTDGYQRLSDAQLAGVSADLTRMFAPGGFEPGIENYGQAVYGRKFATDFMREMNRSVAHWIERWQTPEPR
jgi:FMN reductase (NADPH)